MANKIKLARGTKSRIESVKNTLESNELVYSTDTDELGVKKTDGDVEYFSGRTQIDSMVGDIGGALDLILKDSGGGGGGITKKTVNITFLEIMTQTPITIEVIYNYVGDDPVNYTADFINFTFGGGFSLDMGDGPLPINMVVQALFGKTTLNYFEIIILFRYIISAILIRAVGDGSSGPEIVLLNCAADYAGILPNSIFNGINDVNINNATFTVDFMTQSQDIDFYNSVTGRGSNMSVTVETVGEIEGHFPYASGVESRHFDSTWEALKSNNNLTGHVMAYLQSIGGMTLKLIPNIKMKPNYNGGSFWD